MCGFLITRARPSFTMRARPSFTMQSYMLSNSRALIKLRYKHRPHAPLDRDNPCFLNHGTHAVAYMTRHMSALHDQTCVGLA
jgi:hypothetical protein